jgi:hypothetical protein
VNRNALPAAAGRGRSGQRIANTAALLVMPGLAAVPGVLARVGLVRNGICVVAMLAPSIGLPVLYAAHRGQRAELHDGGLLTAHTLSGPRTVDLARLKKVGRVEVGGRGRSTDRLTLTDVYGVRLHVDRLANGESVDAAVGAAVENSPPPRPAVSRRAAVRLHRALGPSPGGHPRPEPGPNARSRHAGPGGNEVRAALRVPLLALACVPLAFGLLLLGLAVSGTV